MSPSTARPGSRRRPTSANGTNMSKNGGEMPERDLAMDTLTRRARRQDPGPQPLLPRRRDGHHDRYGQGVWLQDHRLPPRRRSLQNRRSAGQTNGICAAMWADWWGFKMEAYDGIKENIPLVDNAGACAIVHSDDPNGIQRLNQEAAKALADGRRAGLSTSATSTPGRWLSSTRPRRSASPTRPAA